MNAGYDSAITAFAGFRERFSGRFSKTTAAATGGVRASIAISGLLLVLSSLGIAMGASSAGDFRAKLVALLPFAIMGADSQPSALAGVVGSGEIVPARELTLSAQASGRISAVPVRVGDSVEEGAVLARIDDVEARRNVQEAETEVARAELALARIGAAPDAPAAAPSSERVTELLNRSYVQVSDLFPSLPDVVSGLDGILNGGFFTDPTNTNHLTAQADRANFEDPAADSMKQRATDAYDNAEKAYEVAIARLRIVPGTPDDATLERVLTEANDAVSALSDATDATTDLYLFLKNHLEERGLGTPPVFEEFEAALADYAATLAELSAAFTGSLEEVRVAQNGTPSGAADTSLQRQEAELELRQAQRALLDARSRLSLYEVKAPFNGVVATLEKKTAQYVADGESVASLMARDALAIVSLGQGEIVRVKTGQGVLVSFDGSDLQIHGRVAEIGKGVPGEDGVVQFLVTIALEPDDRVKPGMQITARFLQE